MSIPKKLLNHLQLRKLKYELLPHKTVFTAFDLAQTLKLKSKEVTKTLVVKLNGKEPVILLLGADKNLDKKKLLNMVNAWIENKKSSPAAILLKEKIRGKARTFEFAKEKWMREKVLGRPGATPPFGSILKMPLFIDVSVMAMKKLILSSGDYETSLVVSLNDYIVLEKPIVGRFGIARK